MRGTIGAVLRTVLVTAGMVVLLNGIVTLAFPNLLADLLSGGQTRSIPGNVGGPGLFSGSMFLSLGTIVASLAVVSLGLAIPGRSRLRLVPQQPFTRGQRRLVYVGSFFLFGLPVVVGLAPLQGLYAALAMLLTGIMVLVGGLMVLYGTATGLQLSST